MSHIPGVHNYYYVENGNLDLQKMRDEAQARSVDKRHKEGSVIHHHAFMTSCHGKHHETYDVGVGRVDHEGPR